MCLGENSANHVVHYVNSQLTALWENSVECTQHAGKNLKPLERVRYDFALREFYVGSKQLSTTTGESELMFSAIFDKPRVDFICNHEAVLYLTIKEGHFNRDFSKLDLSTFQATRARNVELKDLELAFRLDFSIHTIKGATDTVDNESHLIQLLRLNMATANLVSKVALPDGKDALGFYLKKYLAFLRRAGHHTLFSLPDFDDDGQQAQLEFSLLPHFIPNIEQEITEIYGITLDTINESLSSKWLKAIMQEGVSSIEGDVNDKDATCLAEYRSTWTTIGDRKDIQFWIKFGAPKLKILCKREAILSFAIDQLLVFDGNDFTVAPKQTYRDWIISTVVDLVRKEEGHVTRIEIDMKTLRICESLCVYQGFDIGLNWAATLKATIFEFFQYHYSLILEKVSVHIVYIQGIVVDAPFGGIHLPRPAPVSFPPQAPGWLPPRFPARPQPPTGAPLPRPDQHEVGSGPLPILFPHPERPVKVISEEAKTIEETSTGDYDFLQAISVEGIVEHFKFLWQSYKEKTEEYAQCLVKWFFKEDFKASFGSLKVKFLSNQKAVVWVHLQDGFLKSLEGENKCNFMDWSIAFEVDVKIALHDDVVKTSIFWFDRFKDSPAWKQHGDQASRILQHLILDFTTAKFIYDKSKFNGLVLGSRTAVGYVRGVVHYLITSYFRQLTLHGHHILYTTPVWKPESTPPSMGITTLSFQMYSQYNYTVDIVEYSTAVLVLLGMTGFRSLPKGPLKYTGEWVTIGRGSVSFGTVCLSRQVFLEQRLLSLLAKVNGTTTVVPNFCPNSNKGSVAILTGSEESEWGLALTTWAQRMCSSKKTGNTYWKVNSNKAESDYTWEYADKWSYEHQNSENESRNGMYKVSCHTKNLLLFPPALDRSLDIILKGLVTVELVFKGETKDWTTKLESRWSSTLSMKSLPSGSGLSIAVVGDSQPKFNTISTDVQLKNLFDIPTLQSLLTVDLTGLASELRQSFGGVWEYCFLGTGALSLSNPIFNQRGDILFELRPYMPITQVTVVPRTVHRERSWVGRVIDGAQGAAQTLTTAISTAVDGGSRPPIEPRRVWTKSATVTETAVMPTSDGAQNGAEAVSTTIDEKSSDMVEARKISKKSTTVVQQTNGTTSAVLTTDSEKVTPLITPRIEAVAITGSTSSANLNVPSVMMTEISKVVTTPEATL